MEIQEGTSNERRGLTNLEKENEKLIFQQRRTRKLKDLDKKDRIQAEKDAWQKKNQKTYARKGGKSTRIIAAQLAWVVDTQGQ